MNLGAFGVAMLLAHKEDDGYDIGNFKGIGFRYPVLGALLTLFLVSLAGIPPTAGFIGKFYLFSAAVKNGYVGLAVLGDRSAVERSKARRFHAGRDGVMPGVGTVRG
jgi:NADH-quinone oxidoreductase subunit N